MNKQVIIRSIAALCLIGMPSCKEKTEEIVDTPTQLPEWYYTGGKLGTTPLATMNCFEQPTPATERGGLTGEFDRGDQSAERPANTAIPTTRTAHPFRRGHTAPRVSETARCLWSITPKQKPTYRGWQVCRNFTA